jgi:nucleotide-binding universal stress UspA family protein
MKKSITILVPTDFSPASRAGIRFAIQWARQQKAKLILAHVLNIVRMTRWSPQEYETFATEQRRTMLDSLRRLAADVCRQTQFRRQDMSTVLIEGFSADVSLQDFCKSRPDIGMICMGTRGAGRIKKLLGTHTGNLILHSDIPVIAVPAAYRARPIKHLLYASDLAAQEPELRKAIAIARGLKATLSVSHITWPTDTKLDTSFMNKIWSQQYGYPVKMHYDDADSSLSVTDNLKSVIRRRRPSLVVLFTNRDRTAFQRLFLPSQAEGLSFKTTVPLLVIGKAHS